MRNNPAGEEWVLTWAGTIALLRAVGHALVNEDAKRDARLEKAQRAWWAKLKATKPSPSIFWQFIESDRNRLLKEAELTVGQSVEGFQAYSTARPTLRAPPPPPPLRLPNYTYGQSVEVILHSTARPTLRAPRPPPPLRPPNYTYEMNSGPFAGQDPRDLVRDAIDWWEKQLDGIEAAT